MRNSKNKDQSPANNPVADNTTILSTSGLSLTERSYFIELNSSLKRISNADPSNVQEGVASQLELMTIYHNLVLRQARRSFDWALISAGVGLLFFLLAVGFVLYNESQNASIISVICGSLIELISAINFYLYSKTSTQLADFQNRLDKTQSFLLANSICEGLENEHKQQVRAELVRKIANIIDSNQRFQREETSV